MTDEELIARHLATRGVTLCPPGYAAGMSAMEQFVGFAVPPPMADLRTRMSNAAKAARRKKALALA